MYIENRQILEKQWWYYIVEKFILHVYKTLYVKLTFLFHLYMHFLLSRYAWTKNLANILGWFVIAYTVYRPEYHYGHDWKYQQSS